MTATQTPATGDRTTGITTMHSYGERAMAYWQRWLPGRFEGIDDPERFFTELGDQAAQAVTDAWDRMIESDPPPPGESHTDRVARLQRLRAAAEEQVLDDLVFQQPEETAATEPDLALETDQQFTARVAAAGARQLWRSETCNALLDGDLSVDQLTDGDLADVIGYAGPGLLLALGTSIDALRRQGRQV